MTIDRTDLKILSALQKDASLSTAEIAQRVGLSQSPCWRRISLLEADGVIRKRVALLSRDKVGLDVLVFTHVKLASHGWQSLPKFKQKVVSFPEVVQCFMVLGDFDFILLVATRTINHYNEFIQKRLSQVPGVQAIESRIVLEEAKNTTELPLELVGGTVDS
ncbi:MAG TPA: Lrp/AsnC family transcriptional regulator [Steroidobacteraceae bacterium]|nr:Lrp/AsnC family transcriptional regulator [Steroidobacteraceae bacterium]